MLLSLSDLLLSGTLFANAGAVLNFKLGSSVDTSSGGVHGLLQSLRVLRVPLAMWNVLMILLMVIWFPA